MNDTPQQEVDAPFYHLHLIFSSLPGRVMKSARCLEMISSTAGQCPWSLFCDLSVKLTTEMTIKMTPVGNFFFFCQENFSASERPGVMINDVPQTSYVRFFKSPNGHQIHWPILGEEICVLVKEGRAWQACQLIRYKSVSRSSYFALKPISMLGRPCCATTTATLIKYKFLPGVTIRGVSQMTKMDLVIGTGRKKVPGVWWVQLSSNKL